MILHRRSALRLLTALAFAVAGLAAAPPASAAVSHHDGPFLFTTVTNCESVAWGSPYTEQGVGLGASIIYDDAAPPKVGDVFYLALQVGAVGNPFPCLDQTFRPDLVLPDGIELAITNADPIRCLKWVYETPPSSTPETALCPTGPVAPESGGTVGFGTSSGGNWKIPTGTGYEIQVPVVATTPGERIFEFDVRVVDGNSNPIMRPTTPVVAIGGGAPDPASEVAVGAAVEDLVKLGRTGGKVPAWVAASPLGADVKVSVLVSRSGKWSRIGSMTYQEPSAFAEAQKIQVPVTQKWQTALKGRRVDAKLVAVATDLTSGAADRTTVPFDLKG